MNPLPRYNEKGELDTRLRVDPVTGDVGIGTPKEKKYMTKDEALLLALEAMKINNKAWKLLADSGDAGNWEAEEQGYYQLNEQAITAIKAALEAKDEPVAWMNRHGACKTFLFMEVEAGAKEEYTIPVYTQPQREWVGLTDEDKQKLVAEHHDWESLYFAIQAKLKEKNT